MTIVERLRAAGCVFAEDEAALLEGAAPDAGALEAMVGRRVAGEPLEQVVGFAEFCGLRIVVEPGVFVPRRRTEFLAGEAVARLPEGGVAVDLCCGTGAAGAVLARAGGDVYAADVDPAAVRCARRNLPPGRVFAGDLFAALPPRLKGVVTVLVANVPYVPTGDVPFLPAEARDHESRVALDGGPDGLDVLRRVAAEAPSWLAPGGVLLTELSTRQLDTATAILHNAGLTPAILTDDDLGATVATGQVDV
ncbi:putative protein N(5)-glutamine methyltransferase [Actinomadura flavalba]|uniref:putative protein N(5)-glutamine methyltransferase n=1 Tax=Actinomadura flavalba TaxID=1120938 RepID=UPI00037A3E76|nr:putative protein N(5)-glutamine methyltransferase [Actinomadura flavalba]